MQVRRSKAQDAGSIVPTLRTSRRVGQPPSVGWASAPASSVGIRMNVQTLRVLVLHGSSANLRGQTCRNVLQLGGLVLERQRSRRSLGKDMDSQGGCRYAAPHESR